MTMVTESGSSKSYDAYFGENGSLTRKRRTYPDSITRETGMREYTLVNIWEEPGKILHGRTEDGKAYQHLLRIPILSLPPCTDVPDGRASARTTAATRTTTKQRAPSAPESM